MPDPIPPELRALPEYTDLRPLGKGGMGVVYVGTHALMGRPVVLKTLTPAAVGDPTATERFLREIRAAAALDHPNVVKAYAAHRVGRQVVFVMEFVPGDDLAKVVAARGGLPVASACYYAYHAALGLQHAHERGMVHRDIKPGNLLLLKTDSRRVVKVADFGLAKAAREGDDGSLTGTGRLMGTPHYLAPEQALDAAAADIRADIYSLGCTLYHLLAGRPPFDGGSLLGIVDAHRAKTADPLDEARPGVPPALAAVVARMMAKAPAARFQTPAEVANALKPFFQKAPTDDVSLSATSPAVSPPSRPGRWPLAALLAGVAAVALGVYAAAPRPAPADVTAVPLAAPPSPPGASVPSAEPTPPPPPPSADPTPLTPPPAAEPYPETDPTPAPTLTADGYTLLFDRRTTAGWHPDPLNRGRFVAADGRLVLAGGPDPPKTDPLPVALAVTDRADFADFRLRLTYTRSAQTAFCCLAVRTTGGAASEPNRSVYFDGALVSLGGATGNGYARPPGSLLVVGPDQKVRWLAAPGPNPDGPTTLTVEAVGRRVRAFDPDGRQLQEVELPGRSAGRIGLWATADAELRVDSLEVKELAPDPPPPDPTPPETPPAPEPAGPKPAKPAPRKTQSGPATAWLFRMGRDGKPISDTPLRLLANGKIAGNGGGDANGTWVLGNGGKTLILSWPRSDAPPPRKVWVDTYRSTDGTHFSGTNNGKPQATFRGVLSRP